MRNIAFGVSLERLTAMFVLSIEPLPGTAEETGWVGAVVGGGFVAAATGFCCVFTIARPTMAATPTAPSISSSSGVHQSVRGSVTAIVCDMETPRGGGPSGCGHCR